MVYLAILFVILWVIGLAFHATFYGAIHIFLVAGLALFAISAMRRTRLNRRVT